MYKLDINVKTEKYETKKTIMSIAFLLLGLGGLHAQETTTASGNEATGTVREELQYGKLLRSEQKTTKFGNAV